MLGTDDKAVPASPTAASAGWLPLRSDAVSTGDHRVPLGKNILGGVHVPVVRCPALRAVPLAHIQRHGIVTEPARRAQFARRIKAVDADEHTSMPRAFV